MAGIGAHSVALSRRGRHTFEHGEKPIAETGAQAKILIDIRKDKHQDGHY